MADSLIENLGLLGVFVAGAAPWLEAILVIPAGILFGLPVLWTVVLALLGNAITIAIFAVGSERVLASISRWRARRGKASTEDGRSIRAKRIFVRYGDVGMAVVGPLIIGTQFAAAIAVSLGVGAARATWVQICGAVWWGLIAAYGAHFVSNF